MFWIFTLLVALGFSFFKLGVISILVRLLGAGLIVAMAVIAVLVVALIWKRHMSSNTR
ncbi:hypothetical protein LNV09_20555 [Paucibacter sp. B2R-40]|uniref:hypothetical protein n=1 Tax=Paucibacter sp. B2R-40 TaxID=2893554 RepID=UPI0021E3F8AE|nr:hypothetical protein [Paucibacter sp. B2R-40]MCV2356539.1 hypothetical protein [Paucibacter sp. B2R-40]